MGNFWQNLDKPFFILAPMEDVTDTVLRRIVMRTASADVYFTEFTSVDGMFSKGDKKVSERLLFTPEEKQKPLVAQIWGLEIENYTKAAKRIYDMGFDGIDINMGCPEKNVIRKGACSGLIKNHGLAKEIIQATKAGASCLPISIKTRIGFKTIQTEEWVDFLLDQDIAALTIHGRTQAEMSKVPPHWDEIGKAVTIRNAKKKDTCIIGNGDIMSVAQGREMIAKYQLDGIMIGRGLFHNIWIFDEKTDPTNKTLSERLSLLANHVRLFDETWQGKKPFHILKKFFKVYLSGFDGAQDIRTAFMETSTSEEALALAASYQQ